MNTKLIIASMIGVLSLVPAMVFGQAPNLGSASGFVLFSSNGAVTNTGISHLTGNVGTNNGSSTGFGNVNGVMHDHDGASALCASDLLAAWHQIDTTTPSFFPSSLLGNGDTLIAGVYSIAAAATLNLDLTLNGQGDPNAVFIFKIGGSFSVGTASHVRLINGALACNVFWQAEGLVSIAPSATIQGTVIADHAAISFGAGDTLVGRAFSTTGAVTVDGVQACIPAGCGSVLLTGPAAPALGSAACFGVFSSNGPVSNAGVTYVTGDVGTNVGLTTGFNPLFVTGSIHPIPDGTTSVCSTDLLTAYNYINTLSSDIELLYPAQFGNNLVLTPHVYVMNGAVTFTGNLYLDALGDANAVFVIQVNGACSTSTYSKVILINGTQAKNVYWKIDGAVNINDHSFFNGTIICNNGAINLNTGDTLNGRALTTNGALQTSANNITIPSACSPAIINIIEENQKNLAVLLPNPFGSTLSIAIADASVANSYQLSIYNVVGAEVIHSVISSPATTLSTSQLPSGIYSYRISGNHSIAQYGKIIAQQ